MTLTTHVLDVAEGTPAAGIPVRLERLEGEAPRLLASTATNADGRTDAPLGAALDPGIYQLLFSVAAYFAARDKTSFYDEIAIRFRIEETVRHYHVPLLLSPWGYSTYRGS